MEKSFSLFTYPFSGDLSREFDSDSTVSLLSFYGDKSTLCSALQVYFNTPFEVLPDSPGLFLVHSKPAHKAALVVSFGSNQRLDPETKDYFLVSVLLQTSKTIVPCISKYAVQNWYYSTKASFYNHFSANFNKISVDKQLNLSIFVESCKEIKDSRQDLGSPFFSKDCLYRYLEVPIDAGNLVEFRIKSSAAVKKIFEKFVGIEKNEEILNEFFISVDEMLYCEPEVVSSISESLKDFVLKMDSFIGDSLVYMCEVLKNEIFDKNKCLSDSMELQNFSIIDNFQQIVLKQSKPLNYEKIAGKFEKLVVDKLNQSEQELAQTLINKEIQAAKKKITKFSNEIIEQALEKLKFLEMFIIKKMFIIQKLVLKQSDEQLSYEGPDNQIIITSSVLIGDLKNLINLDDSTILCLFENIEQGTSYLFVYSFNEQERRVVLSGVNYEIAHGSDCNSIVLTNNSTQTISVFSYKNSKINAKTEKKITNFINFPHFLKKSNKVLFINEKKQLVFCEIREKATVQFMDLSAFAINTACYHEEFKGLSVSDNEEILAVQLNTRILILNRVLLVRNEIQLTDKTVKKIFFSDFKDKFFLILVQKASMSLYKIEIKNTREKSYFSNKIIDLIEHSADTFLVTPPLACKQVYGYIEKGFNIDTLANYYSVLSKSRKMFKYKGLITDNFQDVCVNYPESHLRTILLKNSSVKLAKFLHFLPLPTSLVTNTKLFQGAEISPVREIKNALAYNFFETEIGNMDSVLVFGLIGLDTASNTKLLQSVFSVYPQNLTKDEISVHYSEKLGKNVVIIAISITSIDCCESLINTFEFFTAICDRIILNLPYSSIDKVYQLIKQIYFSRFRINEPIFYKFILEIIVLDTPDNVPISRIKDYIPKVPEKVGVNIFTLNQIAFLAETQFFYKKILNTQSRFSGLRFIYTLKILIAQIYTGDSHPLSHWDTFSPNSFEATQNECKLSGFCDFAVRHNGNTFVYQPIKLVNGHSGIEYCGSKCLGCESCCELQFGHIGFHSVKRHGGGVRCDVKFFKELKHGVKNWMTEQEVKWHERMWETPYESIYGLVYDFI